MSLVLSLACPTCALPSSLYLSPWAAPWGAPPPLPGSPLVSCQAFCKEKPLGERRKGQKIINFHWPSGEPRVFARKLWLSVVCGGSRLGVVGTGLKPWAWWAAQGSWLGCGPGLLLKVLDPLPEAGRTACLGFCGLSPRGPAPFWQKGRRQAAISKYLVSHRQHAQRHPTRTRRWATAGGFPRHRAAWRLASPPALWFSPFSHFTAGSSQVSQSPWTVTSECFALKTS